MIKILFLVLFATSFAMAQVESTLVVVGDWRAQPIHNFTFVGNGSKFFTLTFTDTFSFSGSMPMDSAACRFIDWLGLYYPTVLSVYRDTITTLRNRLENAEGIIEQYREGTRKKSSENRVH